MALYFQRRMNGISNYLGRSWSPETGCQICDENKIDLTRLQVINKV